MVNSNNFLFFQIVDYWSTILTFFVLPITFCLVNCFLFLNKKIKANNSFLIKRAIAPEIKKQQKNNKKLGLLWITLQVILTILVTTFSNFYPNWFTTVVFNNFLSIILSLSLIFYFLSNFFISWKYYNKVKVMIFLIIFLTTIIKCSMILIIIKYNIFDTILFFSFIFGLIFLTIKIFNSSSKIALKHFRKTIIFLLNTKIFKKVLIINTKTKIIDFKQWVNLLVVFEKQSQIKFNDIAFYIKNKKKVTHIKQDSKNIQIIKTNFVIFILALITKQSTKINKELKIFINGWKMALIQ